MKKLFKVLGVFALLLAAGAAFAWFKFCPKPGANESLNFPADSEYAAWVGKPVELDFVSLDGRKVSSADLRGKVVLVDFWATWCGPCMKSLDHLKSTYNKFHADGFEVVAINFDDDRAALETVVKEQGLAWPQYFEGRNNSLGQKYGISHYPSAWLVDKAGNVRYISALTDTEKKINTLLAETDEQATEYGQRVSEGYLGRLKGGAATIRTLTQEKLARARSVEGATNAAAKKEGVPVSGASLEEYLKLRGVMLSARPSVTIAVGDSNRFVMVGDTFKVRTLNGDVELRCDKIETAGVLLTDVKSGRQIQLKVR